MNKAVKTWSSKPFISHDGFDENNFRAEVKVVKGFGRVVSIVPHKNGGAAKVEFTVDNTDYNPSAWAKVDSNVMKICEEALESGEPIHFRIETRRKPHVDRKIPIEEISDLAKAKDNIVKSLAIVKKEDGDWVISPEAKTRMEEDPTSGGGTSAYDIPLEKLQAASSPAPVSVAAAGGDYSSFENEPSFTHNDDGNVNPGSYAVELRLSVYGQLSQYFAETPVDEKGKIFAVKHFVQAVNRAQLNIYDGRLEAPLLNAHSHKVARELVTMVMENFFPLKTVDVSDNKALAEWEDSVVTKAVKMWKWSLNEVASTKVPTPQNAHDEN